MAFILAAAPATSAPIDVLDATSRLCCAIEVVDSRVADWNVALVDTIADNASSAAFALAERGVDPRSIDLAKLAGRILVTGSAPVEGRSAAVLGDPLAAASWLVDSVSRLGIPLEPGHVLLTGSFVAPIPCVRWRRGSRRDRWVPAGRSHLLLTPIETGASMTDVRPPFELDLQAKYTAQGGTVFMSGLQALVRIPFDQMRLDRRAGLHTAVFATGYPGSPLGGFDRELAAQQNLFDEHNVVHVPGHNEDIAATSVMGSQVASTFPDRLYDGVVGLWYGKAPGVDRSLDAIRHAQYAGTAPHGGVLALVGDDPACKSSSLPSTSEAALRDLNLPVFHPGNIQEALDLGLHGIALSRISGLWSALRVVTPIADGTGTVAVGLDRVKPVLPAIDFRDQPYLPTLTGLSITAPSIPIEAEIYGAKLQIARRYGVENELNRITVASPGAWLGIVSTGYTYHEVLAALRKLGLEERDLPEQGIRVLQVQQLHPLDPAVFRSFSEGLEEILVVEEKRPYLEPYLKEVLYGSPHQPRIVGKVDEHGAPLIPIPGILDVDAIVGPLHSRLVRRVAPERLRAPARRPAALVLAGSARTPYFCSGCPHSTSTRVPEGAMVGGGIGCHGLSLFQDKERVGTIVTTTHMGGEGAQWIGIEPFVELGHLFQNVGDGTYFHSGQLAVQAAVSAGSNITFKLLYNDAVAMTGGQAPAMSNARPVPDLAAKLLAEGVAKVLITTDDPKKYKRIRLPRGVDVWDRTRIIEAQERLAATPGVTVLIHDQQCATERRRDRKRGKVADAPEIIVINERVCEGCGDCGVKSNCLAVEPVETTFGRKTSINQSSCNKDYTCIAGDCPSFVGVERPKRSRKARTSSRVAGGARRRPVPPAGLPEPSRQVGDDVTIRMPGIGGTGVVTVNQILGTAALIDGLEVVGLDQTGLSQKAGPVVSDLRISTKQVGSSNKPSSGQVDVYLVLDLMVGVSPVNLQGLAEDRTHAVVSTSHTPTGTMVSHVDAVYPPEEEMRARVAAAVRPGARFVDALVTSEGLFGETTTSNVFMLGVAYQAGLLPVSAGALEAAIELNGVAVEANTLAFRWGRTWEVDPGAVAEAQVHANGSAPVPAAARELVAALSVGDDDVRQAIEVRTVDLIGYQGERYAKRYVDELRRVHHAETSIDPGSTVVLAAAASGLHKLMAYKDEYEVARLHLDAAEVAKVQAESGGGRVYWYLHPPVLRALGMERKLRLGPWFRPAFVALRAGRRVRGTPIDVFGYAKVRRVEREILGEYEKLLHHLCDTLTEARLDGSAEIVALPDMIRGYEEIKLGNVERYRAAVAERLEALGST